MADVRGGLIIVNTGPGKGKTSAAMGTALRAVGNGMRVLMLQFIKGSWHYGELDAVKAFGDKFIMKQMGRGFVKVGAEKPDPQDVRMVEEAWAEGARAIKSGEWDLVILDEVNYAISYGMLDPGKVAEVLKQKPDMVQIIWKKDLEDNLNVCPKCGKHFRIDARTRLANLFDDGEYETFSEKLVSTDPLKFVDLKPYSERLQRAQEETGLNDAVINARGK